MVEKGLSLYETNKKWEKYLILDQINLISRRNSGLN
jgi:hypothetical protein